MQSETYRCLVVDDEPIARKIVLGYIEQLPFLILASECINALAAIEFLRASPSVDIIFLDINMPNLTGTQLLKIVQPRQPVIFTTAYSEYAVESYELNAVDYLLKPFSFERFTRAVYKAIEVIRKEGGEERTLNEERPRILYIKSDGKNYPVMIDEILYCEAMKNYTKVMLRNGLKLMPLIALSKFEAALSEAGGDFIQVHRSFLVSRKHISAIASNLVTISGHQVPIGVQYRDSFFRHIGMKDKG